MTRTAAAVIGVLLAGAAPSPAGAPESFTVDVSASRVEIHLGRAGLLKALGHDHEIEAPIAEGRVEVVEDDPLRSSVRLLFAAFQTGIEVRTANAMQILMEDTKQYAIKYPKIQYPKYKEGLLYELDMPDLHFGKLAWAEETGQDYDIQIAAQAARDAFTELLGYVEHFPVSKILLPLGNDFFHVNEAGETTVNGTRQMEDTRFLKAGFPPPMYYQVVDTKEVMSKNFGFSSNKLDYVNGFLGLDRKDEMEFEDWKQCVKGSEQHLEKMLD